MGSISRYIDQVGKERIGAFLRSARMKTKPRLSQSAVARAIGYSSAQYISNFERGVCLPTGEVIPLLVDLYSMNQNTLLNIYMSEARRSLYEHLSESRSTTARF